MKFIFCLFFFWSAIFALVYGAILLEETEDPEENAGNCVSKNEEVGFLKVGEEVRLKNSCIKASCARNAEQKKGIIRFVSCGVVDVDPPCRIVEENLYYPYPECCPTGKCD